MKTPEIQKLRREYSLNSLDEKDVDANPLSQFGKWFEEAIHSEVPEPNAMTLATSDKNGEPHARIILLKGYDERGFIFFTNYASRKGQDLEQNPKAELCFLWLELQRQVRIQGTVAKLTKEENEAYFKSRPYASQIGAHASAQSSVVANRAFLDKKFETFLAQYPEGEVPLPATWGGYVVNPGRIEFWQGRMSRLHDRIVYEKIDGNWKIKRLSP